MNKKELLQKVSEIDQKLQTLGDLTVLTQNLSTQKEAMDLFISEAQVQKPAIDAIPGKKQELEGLLSEVESLKTKSIEQLTLNQEAKDAIDTLKTKADEIQKLSIDQLGIISNEKLSNSFDKIRNGLKEDNKKWFWWLFGTSVSLLLAIIVIVIWQTIRGDTIFEISFLVKLALTSPIILFEIFVAKQYGRVQRLIEEYEFKAAISRSLEAYKEIVVDLFKDKEGDEFKKKLDFILDAISKLYASPMANIKVNETKETPINKTLMPILSDIKDIVSDVTGVVPKIKQ
ncbi:MAG: hypothetical protein Q8P69_01680 [bacterium]|nr:hypothetical protein [bacterium]